MAIFQGKRELFDGLKIAGMDYDWKSYPVIHLDMGDRRCNNAEALERSIEQIKNKRYAAKYTASGKTVILFGVNFNSEKRQIDDWRAERSC